MAAVNVSATASCIQIGGHLIMEDSQMNGEAKELRELARQIERLTSESQISSVAMPAVQALIEYLTLRARVMELEGRSES